MKYIIVGGVASGASFACRLRRLDEFSHITIYEKTNFVSYANCGLPYYVSSTIPNKEDLCLQTPLSLKNRFNIEVKVNSEVISINPSKKEIEIKDLIHNKTYIDSYDKLILATGGKAIKLVNNTENIFELKTVEDSLRLKDYIYNNNVKSAIVIGGGFIGLEILENLKKANIDVRLVEANNHILNNFDKDMASFINQELKRNNVKLNLDTLVNKIEKVNNKVKVYTSKGEFISDILIQAIGVKPNSELAKKANLELDIKESIKVDNNYLTSHNDIYALGDLILIKSNIDDSLNYIPLAGFANKQGRQLANYLVNNTSKQIKGNGTSILKVFDIVASSTGYNETQLKSKNIAYNKVYLSPNNHASYYPNFSSLYMKILFRKDNYELLGAQIVGQDGVDKRIDILSIAIQTHLKGYQLADLELSYAPPFSSAKDPINMAGFMIENLKNKLVEQFYIEDVEEYISNSKYQLIDVRTKQEYELGHIKNSINIPVDELRDNLDKLDKSKCICLICQSAIRSYIGCRILFQHGYLCKHLSGGYKFYKTCIEDNN